MNDIANLSYHPAIQAWSKIDPQGKAPSNIEVLKDKHVVKIFRLKGIGPDDNSTYLNKESIL